MTSLPVVKGYPVIDGVVEATDVTFARFFNFTSCSYGVYAIGNNPISPDAVHPMHLAGSTRISTDKASVAFYYPPDPAWIVQEVSKCFSLKFDFHNGFLIMEIILCPLIHGGHIAPLNSHFFCYRTVLIWIVTVPNML